MGLKFQFSGVMPRQPTSRGSLSHGWKLVRAKENEVRIEKESEEEETYLVGGMVSSGGVDGPRWVGSVARWRDGSLAGTRVFFLLFLLGLVVELGSAWPRFPFLP